MSKLGCNFFSLFSQAILDGAGISLPHGSLNECYDELGTRYAIPVYCLSYPINIVSGGRPDSPAEFSVPVNGGVGGDGAGDELKIRVRISLTEDEKRLVVNTNDTVMAAKKKLHTKEGNSGGVPEPARQRWYFAGKLLGDKTRIGDAKIPSGYVVQCVINNLDFEVIKAKD